MREKLKFRIREMLRTGGGRLYDHHWQELLIMAIRAGIPDPMGEVKAAVAEVNENSRSPCGGGRLRQQTY